MDNAEDREIRFFGRVAAGFTHELKNVLAIVKETAGLMEDLLAMTPEGVFPHQPRFQRGITTILEQISRGVDLSTRMNRFAHSPDRSVAQVDLNESVDQVCLLAERFARVKGVTLSVVPAGKPPTVLSCPVKVLLSIFKAYECCWTHLASGASVLGTVISDPQPMVKLTWSGEAAESADPRTAMEGSAEWKDLEVVMGGLQGKVAWEEGPGFSLVFPREISI
jgi:hypothetical protein